MFKFKTIQSSKNYTKNIMFDILQKSAGKPLYLFLSSSLARKNIMKFVDKKISASILNNKNFPLQVNKDKYYMAKSIMLAVNNAFEKANNAPNVRKAIINSLVQNILLRKNDKISKFQNDFDREPPLFLTIGPCKFCNLKCKGCYANSTSANSEKLSWDILNRIIKEKTELWNSYFTVITGGEPLLYRDQGKTVIDLAKKYQNNYFLVYTNGTLINKELAKKLAEVGNITLAISVEGFEKETDERRGNGVHNKIIDAMKTLREAGVPFGISITATKNNADLVVSDEMVDYYFKKQGASYGWIFQLMPIGRADSLELMVTPEQRVKMFRKTQNLVKNKNIFIADFWNSGCASSGCISAGKSGGGYLYIEWNGNVTPCVFNPYSPVNINDIYEKGGTLNDVLEAPFFKSIRQWQKDYAVDKKPDEMGNWIIPCAIKDHYNMMKKLLNKYHPEPIDEPAKAALEDIEYQRGLEKYGQEVAEATDPIWEKEYLNKNKTGKGVKIC